MLEIKKEPNPVLHKKCEPVKNIDDEVRFLIKQMIETMYAGNGIGLAGPQVGVLKKLFVIDVGKGPLVMINPEITESSENKAAMLEGCLSLPGVDVSVERPEKIKVSFQDEYGNKKEITATGITARVVQHENDHLIGKLITDYQGLWERLRERSKNILKRKNNA